ncbi:hypothetical protein Golob_013867 [Gossypium lobatum]|uniref:Uncharacterized protein n=1 Tax=Gossypium lobatum TaxID=34289 RepID=A0A7J8LQV9_9ROSI|nr:hypothetical protein [Gossypium lobatum]
MRLMRMLSLLITLKLI